MLTVQECREQLVEVGNKMSDQEVEGVRDALSSIINAILDDFFEDKQQI
jgi:hypothetical protein